MQRLVIGERHLEPLRETAIKRRDDEPSELHARDSVLRLDREGHRVKERRQVHAPRRQALAAEVDAEELLGEKTRDLFRRALMRPTTSIVPLPGS